MKGSRLRAHGAREMIEKINERLKAQGARYRGDN